MKQLTEDYVSFEIAVLLKEKGFVGESEIGDRCGFYEQNKEYPSQINLVYDDLDNSELEHNECLRFTHQIALKWLREVHELHIDVFIGSDESHDADGVMVDEWHFWTYYITNTSGDMIYDAYNKVDVIEYQTYEEAVEASLLYVLKNLI